MKRLMRAYAFDPRRSAILLIGGDKTGADRWYEPRANETVHDFARHYGTSVLPARPYHPQDKELTSWCTLFG